MKYKSKLITLRHLSDRNKMIALDYKNNTAMERLVKTLADLRYIQELLLHSSSKTTEIYTYVSQNSLVTYRVLQTD